MSSSTTAVARNFSGSDVVPLKSNCGLSRAADPSAVRRNSTWASSWSRTTRANSSSLAAEASSLDGLDIELRLEILEQKREVQDLLILTG